MTTEGWCFHNPEAKKGYLSKRKLSLKKSRKVQKELKRLKIPPKWGKVYKRKSLLFLMGGRFNYEKQFIKGKNLVNIGGNRSRGVILPKAWLELLEIEKVRMTLDIPGKRIVIEPTDSANCIRNEVVHEY